jgi:hypothetical protein
MLPEKRFEADGKISRRGRCLVLSRLVLSRLVLSVLSFRGRLPHN